MTIGDALRPASDTWRPRSALTLIALLCAAVLAAGSARASTSSLDGTTGPIGVRSARLRVSGVLSASLEPFPKAFEGLARKLADS